MNWAWWVNGPETFDVPLIAVASKDGRFTAGLGFQDGLWATVNASDDRACFHLFPHFGALKPGQSATVEGRFYLLKGTPKDMLTKFQKDFPAVEHGPVVFSRAEGVRVSAVEQVKISGYLSDRHKKISLICNTCTTRLIRGGRRSRGRRTPTSAPART